MDPAIWLLLPALLAVAVLYSSVGHAGASGYLAVLALSGMAPEELRPTALTLNIVVALIATFRFGGAGHFRWRTLWPFLAPSVPMAFLGGSLPVDPSHYRLLLGAVLLFAATRLALQVRKAGREMPGVQGGAKPSSVTGTFPTPPPVAWGLFWGAAIGLLSGLVGVGGGIFLSPLLLFAGWATVKEAAGVAAPFILFNSMAALAGQLTLGVSLPVGLPLWLGTVVVGGWIGATFGSRHARPRTLQLLLTAVLLLAGVKLLFSA